MSLRTNRQILSRGKNYANKQLKKFGTDEVTFDKDQRLDYLTGFHKRKIQRQKKAQDFNKEQDRLAKIEQRKNIRAERRQQLDEKLRNFKEGLDLDSDHDEQEVQVGEDEEEWKGFDSDNGSETEKVKPILKTLYSDSTSVSVETLEPNDNFEYLAEVNNVKLDKSREILDQSITRASKYAKFLGIKDADEKTKQKQKKKKFRYLTKNERKANQYKANGNKRRRQ
ncbi:hypothetical protein HG535_0D04810 [Zygotorulaspora mrakii]|uniref:Ribosomal RNA-processing protein 17 n=1 Tax=Zygotorulaspora mrakii TaxID=42260 RepID=A0A7H9B4U1_ZYGMR|nr:uncharacterized protein HG535_0D04810 [Zygotorulaspora mrakii]QLG72772.1 hypothetical protein HG535_0D04810 [Zygotorulaspora mrakii]